MAQREAPGDEVEVPDGKRIIVLAEGRLVKLVAPPVIRASS